MDNQSNVNQPVEQPTGQPVAQPINQPVVDVSAGSNKSKKKMIIIGAIAGVAVIALIVVLLVVFFGHSEKTVSCTTQDSMMGINIEAKTNVKVGDGKLLGGDVAVNVDLTTMRDIYKDYEQELVDEVIDSYKSRCEDHCTFSDDYAAGDYIKITMQYDEEGVDELVYTYGIEGKSAQEIADKIQESMERSDTVCEQY